MPNRILFIAAFSVAALGSRAETSLQLTLDVPQCRSTAAKPLPAAYYAASKDRKSFGWVSAVSRSDAVAGGSGWARQDGSELYDSFSFFRADLNNDGICDWFVNASAPESTGGGRDSINTLYLGQGSGWRRIGATMPVNKPDSLGLGKSLDEQGSYLFGEDLATIHDSAARVNYFVTAFYDQHDRNNGMPGYRIFVWDEKRQTLRLLDKWEPGSVGAQIYEFFKKRGALLPNKAGEPPELARFDPDVEAQETAQACNPGSLWRSSPKIYGAVPQALLAKCRR